MAQPIKLRRSAQQGAVPTTAQLDLGEVAINTFDGKLFIKKNDGTESIVEIGAGGGGGSGGITYKLKTSNYTALDKDGILANTSAGSFTITLPASPSTGASVIVNDASDSFGTNNLTIARNGATIEGNAEDLILDISGISTTLVYTGTTWQVYSQIGALAPVTGNTGGINYVVKNANYTLANRDGIIADSSLGSFTLTLPATPAPGDQVVIADGADFSTNNVTVARNGSTIEGLAENLVLNIQGASVTMIYSGVTWQVYAQIGAQGANISATTTQDILGGAANNLVYQVGTNDTGFIDAPSSSNTFLKWGGSSFSWAQAGLSYSVKTSAYNAVNNDAIIANTSGGPFTITLPASPAVGTSIMFLDGADWSVNNLTLSRNGSTIEGLNENLILNIKGIQVQLVYDGTTWNVFAFTGPDGVTVTNDTSSAGPVYIPWVGTNSGYSSTKVTSTKLYFNPSTGTLNTTDYNSLSDISLKENIETLTDALDTVDSINPVYFTWKDTGKEAFGFIAQEIEEVLPNLVYNNSDSGIKSVSYVQLIPVLVQAIKELRQELREARGELNGNAK